MKEYKTKKQQTEKQINFHSRLVAKDRHLKSLEHTVKTDRDVFNLGYKWFNDGLDLEDADEALRNNFNFVNGFNKSKRVKNINDDLESLGKEWFDSGADLSQAPASYVNNPYFKEGYEKAKRNSNGRTL